MEDQQELILYLLLLHQLVEALQEKVVDREEEETLDNPEEPEMQEDFLHQKETQEEPEDRQDVRQEVAEVAEVVLLEVWDNQDLTVPEAQEETEQEFQHHFLDHQHHLTEHQDHQVQTDILPEAVEEELTVQELIDQVLEDMVEAEQLTHQDQQLPEAEVEQELFMLTHQIIIHQVEEVD
jgi:hypothetical protein